MLPDWVRLLEAAALGDPQELVAGEPVSILYWDDDHQRFAVLQTTIAQIGNGVATVEDPGRVIGPGHSGSGVYDVRGRLVGNVWSILAKNIGERLPWVKVGLLPRDIVRHIS